MYPVAHSPLIESTGVNTQRKITGTFHYSDAEIEALNLMQT